MRSTSAWVPIESCREGMPPDAAQRVLLERDSVIADQRRPKATTASSWISRIQNRFHGLLSIGPERSEGPLKPLTLP